MLVVDVDEMKFALAPHHCCASTCCSKGTFRGLDFFISPLGNREPLRHTEPLPADSCRLKQALGEV